jgi:hypothetical protein
MVTTLHEEVAQVAAYKTSTACHQHSVAIAAWLRFYHTTESLLCCLHSARHHQYACKTFINKQHTDTYRLLA